MALNLQLDYPLRQLDELGYHREMGAREIDTQGEPWSTGTEFQHLWAEPATNTLMLRPLQLDKAFLDSEQQLDSIIRLDQMVINDDDLSNQRVHEQAAFGNANNPWIYHNAVGPASWVPVGNAIQGVLTSIAHAAIDALVVRGDNIYTNASTVPASPPAPMIVGGSNDGKYLFHTKDRLVANQALYLRWWQVQSQTGFPITYSFYIADFCISIRDVFVEVYQDISAHGDRTDWKKLTVKPLFSFNDFSTTGLKSAWLTMTNPAEILSHDRGLLWLPFRHNQVLLFASTGNYTMIQTKAKAKRLADNSDWDITRPDTLVLWALTPSPGRVQIQKVKYDTVHLKTETPPFKLVYTPSATPTVTVTADTDHGSTITPTISSPPAKAITSSNAEDCPPATTVPTSQAKQYGITLDFQGASDGRWSPFLYRLNIDAPRTFKASVGPAPSLVLDTHAADGRIQSATIHAGQKPGDGRLTVKAVDSGAYPLSSYYYRHTMPVQLLSQGTPVFTGITEPSEVTAVHGGNFPRMVTFSAHDLWALPIHTFFSQDRDYTGTGHISAVKDVIEVAGYDATTYPVDTLALTAGNNTPLGLGSVQSLGQSDKTHRPGWQPDKNESAAHFIARVAEKFSGWMTGFHADGTFFYLPRDHHTASEVTFSDVRTGSAPYFYEATFRTLPPEANVLAVIGGDEKTGDLRISPVLVDYASLLNPNVVNYMGRVRTEIVQLTGSYSCQQLNFIGRKMWNAARRRHVTVEFKADFVPTLKVGHVCTLAGYGGTWRIQEYSVEFVREAWRPAHYTAELVETGVGV